MVHVVLALLFLIGQHAAAANAATAIPTTCTATYALGSTLCLAGDTFRSGSPQGAFWPLDEPAGSTVAGDLTGNGHYGTLSAGVTAGAAGQPTGGAPVQPGGLGRHV